MMKTESLVVALDIGGTNTKTAVVSQAGHCVARDRFLTPRTHLKGFLHALASSLEKLRTHTHRIIGLAAGAPNVNTVSQCVVSPPNLPWAGTTPLAKLLQEQFGWPVVLLNDADAAALGELAYGKAKGIEDFLYLTLGTGLGAAVVVGGKPLQGAHGMAAELGHVCFRSAGRQCRCGKRGCLETYVSATALRRTFLALCSEEDTTSTLTHEAIDALHAKAIVEAAQAKDPLAQQALRQTGIWLGEALGNVLNITGSEAVFLAGGLVENGQTLLSTATESMQAQLLPALQHKIKIHRSGLLDTNPAILGAAHHFFCTALP